MANTHSIDFESGSSQYMTIADNAAVRVDDGWTVEFWAKLESLTNSYVFNQRNGENGWGIGFDASGFVTVLAGSDFGKRCVSLVVVAPATETATGDGKMYFPIPDGVGGMNLVGCHAYVVTAGTTNTTDIQIHNLTQAADMLSTKITIDSTETSSRTAATAPVIDTVNDDVADGDIIRIDVDAVSTTPAKGLMLELVFQLA